MILLLTGVENAAAVWGFRIRMHYGKRLTLPRAFDVSASRFNINREPPYLLICIPPKNTMDISALIANIRTLLQHTFASVDGWFDKPNALRAYLPYNGGWSTDQILEHIGLTNHFLLILIDKGAQKALNKSTQDPKLREILESRGSVVVQGTPEEFTNFIKSETAKFAPVIKRAGVVVE